MVRSALPIAWIALRLLILLNILYGVAIALLIAMTIIDTDWAMRGLGVADRPDAPRVLMWMRLAAILGLAAVPLNHAVLARLLAMVETVRSGSPFVRANAYRLHAIAWALAGLQLLSMAIAGAARMASSPEHPFRLDAGFSAAGWLAVLMAFVLARVFAEGTLMREDLDGTI
ncbi:DUF2975 domain-containing protein [Sphingomonas mesophila]|uniref:DUF2975 domain-containing protein n=1 Tax=Sphingomonas mesophila TaxID=2303576 RepID=UPI000E57C8F9|nr:DUF2975 domain-containing protein [Sphingomonas mesophila]